MSASKLNSQVKWTEWSLIVEWGEPHCVFLKAVAWLSLRLPVEQLFSRGFLGSGVSLKFEALSSLAYWCTYVAWNAEPSCPIQPRPFSRYSQHNLINNNNIIFVNFVMYSECGRVTPSGKQLVAGGHTVKKGELPWHAGIYRKSTLPYMQICGGSLISKNLIISGKPCTILSVLDSRLLLNTLSRKEPFFWVHLS